VFDIMEKSSKLLLEIITLVSSTNKMGSDKVFLVGARSFIYIKKSKGPKTDPLELHILLFPIVRKTFQMVLFFCFLFVR
jgi:hypothetical protein